MCHHFNKIQATYSLTAHNALVCFIFPEIKLYIKVTYLYQLPSITTTFCEHPCFIHAWQRTYGSKVTLHMTGAACVIFQITKIFFCIKPQIFSILNFPFYIIIWQCPRQGSLTTIIKLCFKQVLTQISWRLCQIWYLGGAVQNSNYL